jgi:hypothetical protein
VQLFILINLLRKKKEVRETNVRSCKSLQGYSTQSKLNNSTDRIYYLNTSENDINAGSGLAWKSSQTPGKMQEGERLGSAERNIGSREENPLACRIKSLVFLSFYKGHLC